MVWTAISWSFFGSIVALHGKINRMDYLNILADHIHPMALFPDGDGIFQADNTPIHTTHVVKNWYDEHESELETHGVATTFSRSQ